METFAWWRRCHLNVSFTGFAPSLNPSAHEDAHEFLNHGLLPALEVEDKAAIQQLFGFKAEQEGSSLTCFLPQKENFKNEK